MFWTSALVALMMLVASAGDLKRSKIAALPVVVRVHERIELPGILVLQAEDNASRIFAGAGLDVRLERAGRSRPKQKAHYIDLTICDTSEGYYAGALGLARPFRPGGNQVEILYPRVRPIIERREAYAGRILGHVFAHEIAHVLTQIPDHSSEGLMKAKWDSDDFRKMAVEYLPFDARDIAAMRSTVMGWTNDNLADEKDTEQRPAVADCAVLLSSPRTCSGF